MSGFETAQLHLLWCQSGGGCANAHAYTEDCLVLRAAIVIGSFVASLSRVPGGLCELSRGTLLAVV